MKDFFRFLFRPGHFGNNARIQAYLIWTMCAGLLTACIITWNDGGNWMSLWIPVINIVLFGASYQNFKGKQA